MATAVGRPVQGTEDGVAFQVIITNLRLAPPRVDPGGHAGTNPYVSKATSLKDLAVNARRKRTHP